jgi:hypothetical protein
LRSGLRLRHGGGKRDGGKEFSARHQC